MLDSLYRASDLTSSRSPVARRSASDLCSNAVALISGSVTVISGYASTSVGCTVIRQFQHGVAQYVPWVLGDKTLPYLPDLGAAGIQTDRIVWIDATTDERVLHSVDTLLSKGAFPIICAELVDLNAVTPGHFSRFMHRCRQWGVTLLFLVPTSVERTPSPAIRFHIDVDSRDLSILRLHVKRSRIPLVDGVCDVYSSFPLS